MEKERPIQSALERVKDGSLLHFLFRMTRKNGMFYSHCIRKVQEYQEGVELNGTHQLLLLADDKILGYNINTIKRNTVLLEVNKEGGLKVNTKKLRTQPPKCMTKS
jgi:hypothetical protein